MNNIMKFANWVVFAVLIILMLLFLYNVNVNDEFCKTSLINIITLLWAVSVTFWLKEKLSNKIRRNDCIEHVLMEIEETVMGDEIISSNKITARLKQRSCANRIKYLCDSGFDEFKEEFTDIKRHIHEVKELYSNHENDLDVIKDDFLRHQSIICDKCNAVRIKLYQ